MKRNRTSFINFAHIVSNIVQFKMEIQDSFIQLVEESIRANWDRDALTDYKGATLQYKDVARKIEKMHILFEHAGIKKGDKIALCGRNSANWTATFLGVVTYGAVAVPILHEFKADNVHHIVNHSEARMLFVGDQVWEMFNEAAMPNLEGIIELKNFDLVVSRSEKLTYAREHLNEEFGKKYPCRFRAEQVSYRREEPEELAVINYTSGTTGYSKGVMLPYRSIISNIVHIDQKVGLKAGDSIVSMLPLGHIFGLVFDFLYGITKGAHLWFLTRMPSPKIIAESFAVIRPRVIACVPLIVEKIFKKNILPKVDNKLGKLLLNLPIISDKIKEQIRQQAMEVFGGNFIEIVIGGAPFNPEVEAFLRKINFPYTIAYESGFEGVFMNRKRWPILCAIALFAVAILVYANFQKKHTFVLVNDEGMIKSEQIQPLFGTVKVSGDCDTDVVFTDMETGEKYVVGYITSGVSEKIKLEKGKWYTVAGGGNLVISPVNVRVE